MTREKPPDKAWDVWIEQLIQEAKDAGEFDQLEGKGKPIPGVAAPGAPRTRGWRLAPRAAAGRANRAGRPRRG
jgi:DnaJ-like protein